MPPNSFYSDTQTITGPAAAFYLGAIANTAAPGSGGLNVGRLRRDALAASRAALARLRAAAVGPRVLRIPRPQIRVSRSVSGRVRAREHRARRVTRRTQAEPSRPDRGL